MGPAVVRTIYDDGGGGRDKSTGSPCSQIKSYFLGPLGWRPFGLLSSIGMNCHVLCVREFMLFMLNYVNQDVLFFGGRIFSELKKKM